MHISDAFNVIILIFITIIGTIAPCVSAALLRSAEVTATDAKDAAPSHKLLVVSFDAFKPSYLTLGVTPNLLAIAEAGIRSDFMRSTFPTKTFPNHFTLATGLHAGVHGVTNANVYDRRTNRTLTYGWELFHQHDHDWVLPIWVSGVCVCVVFLCCAGNQ